MATKFTAAMLVATALPYSKAFAHSVNNSAAPVTGYLCFMLSIGAAYAVFLLLRMYRRKQEQKH